MQIMMMMMAMKATTPPTMPMMRASMLCARPAAALARPPPWLGLVRGLVVVGGFSSSAPVMMSGSGELVVLWMTRSFVSSVPQFAE